MKPHAHYSQRNRIKFAARPIHILQHLARREPFAAYVTQGTHSIHDYVNSLIVHVIEGSSEKGREAKGKDGG